MHAVNYQFTYEIYDSISELTEEDAWLLEEARQVTEQAYAPYSNFYVGAVAKLANGEIIAGSNQENASFPVGLCAERVVLASVASLFPKIPIETMAISYQSGTVESNHPISPCGICRQSLQEYEGRVRAPIRLILGGQSGKVYIIPKASWLLPLSFTGEELGI
ncbi:cytidine deaminase [Flavihumibacter sp. CACIAM 22H1]|uniref:cytidine deaminase n=1 Tax=Flavihumibacter sp. CACIAM 22H1 TaxID=1812911 RepID=UPI0007A89FE7|nr:cytidine deaminase [Flavihumibacter sp. CACIAM 22H1]KYP15872.1 MAG: cytidine deaminase [Flavihumibacter sp. CACIAM 22H1]